MTWKLYALGSGGAFLATYAMSLGPSADPGRVEQVSAQQPAVLEYEAPTDFLEQTERLRMRLTETPKYRQPDRNAFRFGAALRPTPVESVIGETPAISPDPIVPPRPPFAVAGIASDVVDGAASHTAILSSLRGVILAREGDVVEGGYRVVRVDETGITVESPDGSGQQIDVRLPGR